MPCMNRVLICHWQYHTRKNHNISPVFAYTPLGIRLGKGKGYYDRFLATLEPGPLTVGLCFEKQLLHEIPSDTHDMVVNAVVTENGWAATGI